MFSLSTLGLNSVPFVTGVTHQINPRKHTQIIPNITDARHVSSLYIYIYFTSEALDHVECHAD